PIVSVMSVNITCRFLCLCFGFASVLGSDIRPRQGPRDCAEVYRAGDRYEGYYAIFPNPGNPGEIGIAYCGVDDGLIALESSAPRTSPENCQDLQDGGMSESGINIIFPYDDHPETPVIVFCEQSVMGGGWTVFQRRDDYSSQLDFYRDFGEYAIGFGSPGAEFWLGNEIIHELTNQKVSELYIDLTSFAGETKYAHYAIFNVGNLTGGAYEGPFQLTTSHYSGSAGDSLSDHNGMAFTAYDIDNDLWSSGNCAVYYKGAWWHRDTARSNLNGLYFVDNNNRLDYTSAFWNTFSDNIYEPLRLIQMMTRPLRQKN
ncbi:unnamed protein product, partial [Meganyctiphanes norvegica]